MILSVLSKYDEVDIDTMIQNNQESEGIVHGCNSKVS